MMKKWFLLSLVCMGMMSCLSGAAIIYQPDDGAGNPADLDDLDHYYYYTWGINLGFNSLDNEIDSAVLKINNINNWKDEENVLYIHLLDGTTPDIPAGFTAYEDNFEGFENAFDGQGIQIDAWVDADAQTNDCLVYILNPNQLEILNAYAQDGYIVFGFDPDCHYYNQGASFTLTTVVPAPGAVALSGLGVLVVGYLRRRKQI